MMYVRNFLKKNGCDGDIQEKLKICCLNSVSDVMTCHLQETASKLSVSAHIIEELRRNLVTQFASFPLHGTNLYEETLRLLKILPTGIDNIDELLDGGLHTGEIVEVFGPAASGKTQLCLSIAGHVTTHLKLNVLYIDSTSSFSSERLLQIIQPKDDQSSPLSLKAALSRVRCLKSFNLFDVLKQLSKTEEALQSEKDAFLSHVKLIVIDSISAVISPWLGGQQQQGHALMMQLGTCLKRIATYFGIAVLVVNNAVADYGHSSMNKLKPALGMSWRNVPHVRLFVNFNETHHMNVSFERLVTIWKHSRQNLFISTSVYIKPCGVVSLPIETEEETS